MPLSTHLTFTNIQFQFIVLSSTNIRTYHEVETLLVELGEVPGHGMQSNMLVLQTEPLPHIFQFFQVECFSVTFPWIPTQETLASEM